MRIAIDARELTGKPTGVGRYLSSVLSAWSRLPDARAHEFVLCLPEPAPNPCPPSLPVSMATAPGRGTLWQQLTLPRLLHSIRADVVYAPAYSGPIVSGVPMVLSMFDVSFAAHPEWFSRREGLQRRLAGRLSARRAARVLTSSEFSKREIVRHLGVDPAVVDVIYPGVTALGTVDADRWAGRVTFDRDPSADPVVLYAGSIFNRRHVADLIEGFSLYAGRSARWPRPRLELVGENRTMPHEDIEGMIARSPVRDLIQARSYVTDAQLSRLYREASAFVFCSEYEGFGMTPLEALAVGIPIIVLDTEVAREVYGAAAHYVSHADPASIATAIERVLFDPVERARILEAAPAVLARYSWQECGRRTLQALLASAA